MRPVPPERRAALLTDCNLHGSSWIVGSCRLLFLIPERGGSGSADPVLFYRFLFPAVQAADFVDGRANLFLHFFTMDLYSRL